MLSFSSTGSPLQIHLTEGSGLVVTGNDQIANCKIAERTMGSMEVSI